MEFSFRGPPSFWDHIIEMAEAAKRGGTDYWATGPENDPAATGDIRITFIGDPEGDGFGALFIPDEDHMRDATPWLELSDRVADA